MLIDIVFLLRFSGRKERDASHQHVAELCMYMSMYMSQTTPSLEPYNFELLTVQTPDMSRPILMHHT